MPLVTVLILGYCVNFKSQLTKNHSNESTNYMQQLITGLLFVV